MILLDIIGLFHYRQALPTIGLQHTNMSNMNRKATFNIPNILTFSRIAIIPVIVALLMLQGEDQTPETNRLYSWIAAGLFIIAGISDIVDGVVARKMGQVSLMGKFFDPVADKLVHMAAMVMLVPMGRFPAWVCLVFLFREILITGLRSIAAGEGLIISAGALGKKKTIWLNIGLSGLLIYYPFWGINPYTIGWVAVGVAGVYSVLSGGEYMALFFREIYKKEK